MIQLKRNNISTCGNWNALSFLDWKCCIQEKNVDNNYCVWFLLLFHLETHVTRIFHWINSRYYTQLYHYNVETECLRDSRALQISCLIILSLATYTTSLHICFSSRSLSFPHGYAQTNIRKVSDRAGACEHSILPVVVHVNVQREARLHAACRATHVRLLGRDFIVHVVWHQCEIWGWFQTRDKAISNWITDFWAHNKMHLLWTFLKPGKEGGTIVRAFPSTYTFHLACLRSRLSTVYVFNKYVPDWSTVSLPSYVHM